MTDATNDSSTPQRLNDEELDLVIGGASWQAVMEKDMYDTFLMYKRDSRQFKAATFNDFLQYFYRKRPEYLKCRDAWIAAGKPEDLSFSMGKDGVITSQYFPGSSLLQK